MFNVRTDAADCGASVSLMEWAIILFLFLIICGAAFGRREKPSEEQIRKRAYYKWVGAGRPPGRDTEFWLAAEWELKRKLKE
jgi:hypothetical protein